MFTRNYYKRNDRSESQITEFADADALNDLRKAHLFEMDRSPMHDRKIAADC